MTQRSVAPRYVARFSIHFTLRGYSPHGKHAVEYSLLLARLGVKRNRTTDAGVSRCVC